MTISEKKYGKQFDLIVKQYFENAQNVEALNKSPNPKKALYEIANKLATNFCLSNGISPTDEIAKEILSSFGSRIENLSKEQRIVYDFNFKAELVANKVTKNIETLARINSTTIPTTDIVVDRSIAREFLPSYERRISELEGEKIKYEKLLSRKGNEKAKETFRNKLQEAEKELEGLTSTVKELTSGEKQFVEIRIPVNPKDKFMDMPQREISAIISADSSQVDPSSLEVFQSLKKNIKTLSFSLSATTKRLGVLLDQIPAEDLKPEYLNIAIEKKDYALTVTLAQKMLDNLTKGFDENNVSFPLSAQQEQRMNSIVEMHSLLNSQKKNSTLISTFVAQMEERVNISTITAHLEKHEKLTDTILLNADKSKESSLSKNLKESEAKFVKLFAKLTVNEIETDTQREYLGTMLERAIGNKSLNSKLTAFSQEKGNAAYSKYQYPVGDIKYFSYKTRHADKILDINKKCERNLELLAAGQKVGESEKLSQFEYGVLCDIAKMKGVLDEYNEKGVIPKTGKLADLYEQSKQSYELVKQINARSVSKERYKPGDILMVHSKKSHASKDKRADQETALTHTFISKYGHAAQIFLDPEKGTPSISHIYGSHQVDKVQGQDIATADIFRVDPTKLVSKENAELLDKFYKSQGKDWKEEVSKMYQDIVQEIHEKSQERFEIVKNDKAARFQAGLANFGLYGGHTSRAPQDFGEVHESMLGLNDRSVKEKMICSEFVAKSTVAAFVELNERLGQNLDEHNLPRGKDDLVRVPISPNERLERIHPQRLVTLLDQAGCLKEVERDEVISGLVSQERLHKSEKSKDIAKDLYNKMNELANQSESREQFVENGKKIFEIYIKSENIANPSNTKEEILQHLDKSLKDFHQEYDKRHPKTFGGKFKQLLNNFAEWVGIKDNKAKNIIKNTIKCIEEGVDKQEVGIDKTSKSKENRYTKILKDSPITTKDRPRRHSSTTNPTEMRKKPEQRRMTL